MSKYSEEDSKPISSNLGYPYNILPKGYPDKISNKEIQETINKMLNHLKGNAGAIYNSDYSLINIGFNELNNRRNNKYTKIALILSIISIIIAISVFFVSIKGSIKNNKILNHQLNVLESILYNIQYNK